MEDKEKIIQRFLDFDPKVAREQREVLAKAQMEELQKALEAGPTIESTIKCMRSYCTEMRWAVPDKESVLCRDHTMEVFRGEAKAPPLRRNIDYQASGRRIFLIEDFKDK
jgi:hypothetical protein